MSPLDTDAIAARLKNATDYTGPIGDRVDFKAAPHDVAKYVRTAPVGVVAYQDNGRTLKVFVADRAPCGSGNAVSDKGLGVGGERAADPIDPA